MSSNKYDICFAWDTTGSMSPCIAQVRNNIKKITNELFEKIPGLRVSFVVFQDYNDDYMWKSIDFTVEKDSLIHFVENLRSVPGIVGPSSWRANGEGMEECYEYVLKKVPELNWFSDSMRSLVIIGDAPPHSKEVALDNVDWREELQKVKEKGINIFSVQALNWGNRPQIRDFFRTIAVETNGYHLYLNQFSHIVDMMTAICYKQMGAERLESYENELRVRDSGMTKSMVQMFEVLLGRRTIDEVEQENIRTYDYSTTSSSSSSSSTTTTNSVSTAVLTNPTTTAPKQTRAKKAKADYSQVREEDLTLKPCNPNRFQVVDVVSDVDIKQFATDNGLEFKKGAIYYLFNKPEIIQMNKEIILQEKTSGDFYEGLKARKLLNLITYDDTKKIKPTDFAQYNVFIQSTSVTRKMVGGTLALYDTSAFM